MRARAGNRYFTAAKIQCTNTQPSVCFHGENSVFAIDALCCSGIITHVSSAHSTSTMNSMSGVCKASVFLHVIIMLHNKIIFYVMFLK